MKTIFLDFSFFSFYYLYFFFHEEDEVGERSVKASGLMAGSQEARWN